MTKKQGKLKEVLHIEEIAEKWGKQDSLIKTRGTEWLSSQFSKCIPSLISKKKNSVTAWLLDISWLSSLIQE